MKLAGSTCEPLRTFTPVSKVWLATEIAVTYAQVRWWLRRPNIAQTVAAARRVGESDDHGGPHVDLPSNEALLGVRFGFIIQRIFRLLPGDTRCLTRSIVLLRMLSRRHVGASLVIGIRLAPTFGAHAWVEHAGQPLLEPIEEAGQRLLEL